jgi:hypothetical protein
MFVLAQVSSMNTRRSGSRSIWPSNHARRCLRTSGRSCSMAWPVFFARDAVAAKEPLDRAVAEPVTLRTEGAAQLLDGDVGGRVQQVLDQLALRFDPPGPAVATEWTGTRIALHPLKCTPTAHARSADPEPRRGFPMTGACGDHRQNPGPKIEGKRLRHARRPPSPADSLNQNSPAMGIPNRCNHTSLTKFARTGAARGSW